MDSILTSIKKLIGPAEKQEYFDVDLIIHINSVFMILMQLGVGPAKGYSITDKFNTWDEFMPTNSKNFEAVKTYMYLKTKLVFDPPSSAAVIESIERMIGELEWRLNVQ